MDKFVTRKRKYETNEEEDIKKIKAEVKSEEDETEKNGPHNESNKLPETLESIEEFKKELKWRRIRGENLNCDYCILYKRDFADQLLKECESTLTYNEGQLARVQIFGKWHNIPRKQVAYGDDGLAYRFSNNTVPARPWIPFLQNIKDHISKVTGQEFNFVLINRYHDGNDHMGEHRDDEKDLVSGHPIASLSLGQPRDFIFKHADARGKNAKRKIDPVKIELQHGSLLMMNHPTNTYWYHALPPRKRVPNVRINMTFRKMAVK